MPVDPSTPTSFRILLQGKPDRKFEFETIVPYAALRWIIALLFAALGWQTILGTVDALAQPGDQRNPIAEQRPDDQGDERGQGQGQGTSQGQGPGVGRGNGTETPSGSTTVPGGSSSTTTSTPSGSSTTSTPGSTSSSSTVPGGGGSTTTLPGPTVTTNPTTIPTFPFPFPTTTIPCVCSS